MGKLLTRSLRLACTTAADALVNYSAMITDVYVLQRSEISHCPDGKIADALALILACTSANDASINYRLCVPQRLQKLPSPRWEMLVDMSISILIFDDGCCLDLSVSSTCHLRLKNPKFPIAPVGRWLTCPNRLSSFNSDRYLVLSGTCTCQPHLLTSHRPDGIFTCFALVLAGRRCLHQQWHGELLIVHHHGQHSLRCTCSRSKVPIAPMGDSYFACCLQGGGVVVYSGTVTFSLCTITGNSAGNVCAHAQKFPSPRWENC